MSHVKHGVKSVRFSQVKLFDRACNHAHQAIVDAVGGAVYEAGNVWTLLSTRSYTDHDLRPVPSPGLTLHVVLTACA